MKISDIIPLLNADKSIPEIAKHFNKSIPRINVYIAVLRKEGYKFKAPKKGRPAMEI